MFLVFELHSAFGCCRDRSQLFQSPVEFNLDQWVRIADKPFPEKVGVLNDGVL